jgi:signal peptidase I
MDAAEVPVAPPPKADKPWYIRAIIGRNPAYTIFRAIVWAVFLVVMYNVAFIGVRIRGNSMEPNFMDGQVRFINRLSYLRHPPQRGDVVAFRADEYDALILKRVIGLPGETVSVHGRGRIYIDGKPLEEPYSVKGATTYRGERKLEQNQFFLLGDNRDVSAAFVKFDYQILGKILLK